MKKQFLFFAILFTLAFGGISVSAQIQCDRNSTPIKCGYYDEGYMDGVADGNSNRSSDYRRYRSKFESQYENNYRTGYEAGYDSVRPSTRWSYSQRNAYDSGYDIGQNDRRGGGQNRPAESNRGYDQNIGLYFQQGYNDGFSNRRRTYDVPLSGNNYPPPPSGGNSNATWSGRVDDRANIIIRGNNITVENVSGNGVQTTDQNVSRALPRRSTIVSAQKIEGRGDVTVIQQPSQFNNYTAIIQVYDRSGGAGNYRIDMSWAGSSNVEEPYQGGGVRWRGRVDQTANIVISGNDVQTLNISGNGVSGVTFDINGYLAQRPGSVNVRKRNGRGTVTIIQQPNRSNDFTAIVQIFDPGSGADNYEVDITW